MSELSGILTLAHRDFVKLLRDRTRIVADFSFPLIFIGILRPMLQAGFGDASGINLLHFVFTGVLAQTVWQSTALGVISLVALPQAGAIIAFGVLLGVPFTAAQLGGLLVALIVVALYGGAFGVLVLSRLQNQRQANQIFPFVMLPQFFLAGIFNPIGNLPWFLDTLSKLAPMRYAVDLVRDVYYAGGPAVAVFNLPTNVAIIAAGFVIFMIIGTAGFVRAERNR